MSRQLRVLFPGALYHVTTRGNNRADIYLCGDDRETFLDELGRQVDRYGWLCHGYCLMGNHYHMVVETPFANLPDGMRDLNGRYACEFNRRHARVGHLFQRRYRAVLVEKDAYLLELVRYVVLNPVRAGLCERPEDWRWSSFRPLLGLEPRPAWLACDWLLGQLANDRGRARERLAEFVQDGIAAPTELPVRSGMYLASDRFIADRVADRTPLLEVPRLQWQPLRPPLEEILRTSSDPIVEAHRRWGYTQREIAERLGRHYSTVSRRLRQVELANVA